MYKQYFILLLISLVVGCQTSSNKIDKRLIGIWQTSPVMGAGWDDCYSFSENGTFVFRYNQSVCDNPKKGFGGEWQIKGDTLYLSKMTEMVIVGGELVDSKGSCISEKQIINGRDSVYSLKNPIKIKLSITNVVNDQNFGKLFINIGGIGYWKHREDPKDYN